MAELSAQDRAGLLGDLGWHWGDVYEVDLDGATYTAHRIGDAGHVLTAETEDELRLAIRSDYFAWLDERAEGLRLACGSEGQP